MSACTMLWGAMFGVRGEWPLVGRDDEYSSMLSALRDDQRVGVILTGQPGMGKTALARHAARQLGEDWDLTLVRGSQAASRVQYGALNYLLSDVGDDALSHPAVLLRRLQTFFSPPDKPRQTLLLVDNAAALDGHSAMALAHLARVKAVKLLIMSQNLSTTPSDFGHLWKDGLLCRIDLGPLTLESASELLTGGLKGDVAWSVVVDLWRISGGNPLFLQALSQELRDSGHLIQTEGVWVKGPEATAGIGRSLSEWIGDRLSRLTPAERAVAEIVSIVGVVPPDLLSELADPEPIDNLLNLGLIELVDSGKPMIRFASALIGDIVGQQQADLSDRIHLERLAAVTQRDPLPLMGRIKYSLWRLDRGLTITEEAALEMARVANHHCDAVGALRALTTIPAGARSVASVLEEAKAHCVLGDLDRSLTLLEQQMTEDPAAQELADWVALRLFKCQILVRLHHRFTELDGLLSEVRRRVSSAAANGSGGAADLILQTELVAIELSAYNGHYPELLSAVDALFRDHQAIDLNTRLTLSLWRAEALCLTGRQVEAEQLTRLVISRLADDDVSPLLTEAARARLFSVLLVAGQWEQCRALVTAHDTQPGPGKYDGSVSQLAAGCLHAYAGRGEEALAKLLPALSQLKIDDRHVFRPLAEAAAAYSASLMGDRTAVQVHLAQVDLKTQRLDWRTLRATEYFVSLAMTAQRSDIEVARQMAKMAAEDQARGASGHALFFLCQSVQLGLTGEADRLSAYGRDSQGVYGQLCALYGKGLASGDTDQLLKAATLAAEHGNDLLAHRIARLVRIGPGTGEGTQGADPALLFAALGHLGGDAKQVLLNRLTARERTIAVAVAQGASNRQIAEKLVLSVRTVEAHMHQVYSKLEVKNRKQLRAILG